MSEIPFKNDDRERNGRLAVASGPNAKISSCLSVPATRKFRTLNMKVKQKLEGMGAEIVSDVHGRDQDKN